MRHVGERGGEATLPGRPADEAHVLDEDVHGAFGREEPAVEHPPPPVFEHKRAGRAVPDRLVHGLGVEAQGPGVGERLPRRGDVDAAQELVDELHGLAVPGRRPAVDHRGAHGLERGPELPEEVLGAPGHDE